ncbi:hypothetical protein LSAT2_023144 [Lamellibrachia satsuma]|nr:hypothetical protein LSAT2_023144 [Lamellibrachia satsuma]
MIPLTQSDSVPAVILLLTWILPLHVSIVSTASKVEEPSDISRTRHNWTGGDEAYEWIWMNGPNIGDQHSKLSSSTPQYPGSRAETASWRDIYGNVWTFGGFGYDGKTTRTPRVLNDLWLWNATTKVWTVVRQEHGDKGKVRLMPQARHGAAACGVTGATTWAGSDESLYLFGGNKNPKQLQDVVPLMVTPTATEDNVKLCRQLADVKQLCGNTTTLCILQEALDMTDVTN